LIPLLDAAYVSGSRGEGLRERIGSAVSSVDLLGALPTEQSRHFICKGNATRREHRRPQQAQPFRKTRIAAAIELATIAAAIELTRIAAAIELTFHWFGEVAVAGRLVEEVGRRGERNVRHMGVPQSVKLAAQKLLTALDHELCEVDRVLIILLVDANVNEK
jgi:hypothetical protein